MKTDQPAKTVAIAYGLNEGPRLARRLHRALQEAGYTITTDHAGADVIIAHSGGCFVLDPRPGQRIIMIGLPYWPNRSVLTSLCIKIASDFYHHHRKGELVFWLHKTGWNAVYSLKIRSHMRMLQGRRRGAHWRFQHVTVARNIHDAMCTPNLSELPFTTPQDFVELPGHHDECWVDPSPVVELVQQAAPLAGKQ